MQRTHTPYLDLFKKADQVYVYYKESGLLLSKLGKEPRQDIYVAASVVNRRRRRTTCMYSMYSISIKKV